MVDFTRETVIDVAGVAKMFRVNPVTVRRWFKRGLEWSRVGGKIVTTLEAINRFSRAGLHSDQTITAVVVDQETLAAIQSLRARGFKIGQEGSKDGRQTKERAR